MAPSAGLPGENTLISQDARVLGSFSAQRRPISTAASPAVFSPSTLSRIPGRRSDTATPASTSSPRPPRLPDTKFSRCYAGDGSLRLEHRSPQPRHGSLRFKRRCASDGSSRFERRPPQLRHYLGDGSQRLRRRSSQPRHGSPHTKRRPPSRAPRSSQTGASACFSEGALLLHLPAMR